MAYSDFTADRLTNDFGVDFRGENLFADVPEVDSSPWLIEALHRANILGFGTEKSRSERLVTPLLLELANRNQRTFSIISGANMDADPTRGLNGECDFVFSFSRIQDFLMAPVFCITEAKRQDLEQDTIQCAAQLIGARQVNEREKHPLPVLYGCSTTGVEWRFVRFENDVFVFDETRYLISNPNKLLGILQLIISESKAAYLSLRNNSQ